MRRICTIKSNIFVIVSMSMLEVLNQDGVLVGLNENAAVVNIDKSLVEVAGLL